MSWTANRHDETGPLGGRDRELSTTIEDFPGGYDTLLGNEVSICQAGRNSGRPGPRTRPAAAVADDALSAVDHTEAKFLAPGDALPAGPP